MGNYLLFVGDNYYPCGGWKDFKGFFNTLESAKDAGRDVMEEGDNDWYHVVDLHSGCIVHSFNGL